MLKNFRQITAELPFSGLDMRSQALIMTVFVSLLIVGWGYLGYMAWAMDNMHWVEMWMPPRADSRAWQFYDFFMLFSMWVLMMTAMMLPSVIPMVAMYATVQRSKRQKGEPAVPVTIFILAYLVSWSLYSAVATGLQWYLHISGLLNPMMYTRNYLFSGSILLIAGLYQWTPLKDVCLHKCRSPLAFLMGSWRDGWGGAFRMGFHHGLYCVGCCWALMSILFAVGVMNMLWVVGLALFAILEKTLLPPRLGRQITGALLCVWGGWWLLTGAGW